MSKRLPYFQFEPAEYLAGDIMFCSYGAQGVFNIINSLYWQKDCDLKYSQIKKRITNGELIDELIENDIIKIENDKIIINFLDEQYQNATNKSKTNSTNGKKGAKVRWQNNSRAIATPSKTDSESIALRENKIKENKIIKKDIIERKSEFLNSLQTHFLNENDLNDFFGYWTEHGEKDKKMKFEKEKSFGLERRILTWMKNAEKFAIKDQLNGKEKLTGAEAFKNLIYGSSTNL